MHRKNLSLVAAVLCVGLLAAGCAKPPQQELDGVKANMAAAEAEASKWAPEAWANVTAASNAVEAELQAQNGKFALLRSYNKTKELIAAEQKAVDDAKAAAVAGKEKAKTDASAAIQAAKDSLKTASDAMTALDGCKKKPKEFKKDMEAMKAKYDGLNAQAASLDSAFASEDYNGAKSAADALKGQADAMTAEFAAAKVTIKC